MGTSLQPRQTLLLLLLLLLPLAILFVVDYDSVPVLTVFYNLGIRIVVGVVASIGREKGSVVENIDTKHLLSSDAVHTRVPCAVGTPRQPGTCGCCRSRGKDRGGVWKGV